MSPSNTLRAAVYGALPLPPGTSLSWIPPSSLYCCHRSASMISAADRNLRMAASPCVRPALSSAANAVTPLASSPEPTVPAPAASPVSKKERRLVKRLGSFGLCPMTPPYRVPASEKARQVHGLPTRADIVAPLLAMNNQGGHEFAAI